MSMGHHKWWCRFLTFWHVMFGIGQSAGNYGGVCHRCLLDIRGKGFEHANSEYFDYKCPKCKKGLGLCESTKCGGVDFGDICGYEKD